MTESIFDVAGVAGDQDKWVLQCSGKGLFAVHVHQHTVVAAPGAKFIELLPGKPLAGHRGLQITHLDTPALFPTWIEDDPADHIPRRVHRLDLVPNISAMFPALVEHFYLLHRP